MSVMFDHVIIAQYHKHHVSLRDYEENGRNRSFAVVARVPPLEIWKRAGYETGTGGPYDTQVHHPSVHCLVEIERGCDGLIATCLETHEFGAKWIAGRRALLEKIEQLIS